MHSSNLLSMRKLSTATQDVYLKFQNPITLYRLLSLAIDLNVIWKLKTTKMLIKMQIKRSILMPITWRVSREGELQLITHQDWDRQEEIFWDHYLWNFLNKSQNIWRRLLIKLINLNYLQTRNWKGKFCLILELIFVIYKSLKEMWTKLKKVESMNLKDNLIKLIFKKWTLIYSIWKIYRQKRKT